MALSWNEIKDRALKFSNEWEGESRERAEKDSFWNDFFNVFGISRRRLATFEEPVKKLSGNQGFIDLFWKGTLLVEHKSKGRDLDAAFTQATDYFHGIKEHELPQYVLVSDFEKFKLYDLDSREEHEFELKDFHKNIKLFGFIAGYQKRSFKEEDPVNIKAAELMGKLHDELEDTGYEGHPLEVMLVRLLFCLFADDTGIFEKDTFKDAVEIKTNEDGSDLGSWLAQFFQVLNTPHDKRMRSLDEHLKAFPYVNGKLFEEPLPISAFNSSMRDILIKCCALDWGKISPAIFGSMFQSVMDPQERRNLGAHYTSEKNILKLIKPLFLDELQEEFQKVKTNKSKLKDFHKKLGQLKFLDPACGCGNFLIITYRELRLLELEVLKMLYKMDDGVQGALGIDHILLVDVDQFYGIEYDEFPARIAEVALWLMDHQMNLLVSEAFGLYYARLPLRKSAKIVHGNALQIDWQEVISKDKLSYILGNPPFYGSKNQTVEQKKDMKNVFGNLKGAGTLDYVSAWYLKASKIIAKTEIKCAFVSTNSITQGEQVSILWNELINAHKTKIHFAHRTFNWHNEAKGNAAVHVVIVGFASFDSRNKRLFEYSDVKGEPHEVLAKNINPYLVDAPNSVATSRSKPLCDVEEVIRGSETTDNGHFMLTLEEKESLIAQYPNSEKFIRTFQGGGDIINNKFRYCLWLKDVSASDYRNIPFVMNRIKAVKDFRANSKKERTRKWADFPTLFSEDRQPNSDYLVIPKVSSERRKYVPIAYLNSSVIINNTVSALTNASLWYFGIITSQMHMTWLKYTCGRMKSDLIYSIQVVYNNYPWPKKPSEKNKKAVEAKAQKVLDIRAEFPDNSLADLYDPLTMPPKLVKAHQELDKAVDLCYRPQAFTNEAARIAYLFELYAEYTAPLFNDGKKGKKK